MGKLGIHDIRRAALAEIAKHPTGIRFSELVKALVAANPDTNANTIYTQVSELPKNFPAEVIKPSRGIFQLSSSADLHPADEIASTNTTAQLMPSLLERDFYESFANWLKAELDEATHIVPLGGGGIKGKWGTPDVLGVYKSSPRDAVKFPIEIITAEVKTDPFQPVVAFGQAIAYRLFSHRVYIAMPATLTEEDKSRLESLCLIFGIGLVMFTLNKEQPDYKIRVRAQTHQPDAFYVNQFAARLESHNGEVFQMLFT